MKNKHKWKVFGFSFLGIIIVAVSSLGIEYYRLQPNNHFKNVPVVSSGITGSKTNQTKSNSNSNSSSTAFNVLILGSDARPGDKIGHSDTMMIAHVDLSKNQINAISIPRDTRVYLEGYGYTKLTSVQYILQADKGSKQGVEGAVKAIGNFTGVPINYYAETNFEGLQAMVDALGGINMIVPETDKIGNKVIQAGPHFVNGSMALAIARERHSLANGDYGRQMAQLEVIKGIGKEALSPGNIPKLPSLVNSLSKFLIATNMSTSDMLSIGIAVKDFDPNKQVHYEQIPGTQKVMYDDILKANNDEIVIDPQVLKSTILKYFQ